MPGGVQAPDPPTVGCVCEELVSQPVELPGGELRVLQPLEAAELPDDGAVEWAPLAPYWSIIWRSMRGSNVIVSK